MRVVGRFPNKDTEFRDNQSQIELEVGQIFAQAVNEEPKAGPPRTRHTMPVTGGTGGYCGYRGQFTVSANGRTISAKLSAPSGKAKPIRWFEDLGKGVVGREITGGTGNYVGVPGQVSSVEQSAAVWRKTGRFWR